MHVCSGDPEGPDGSVGMLGGGASTGQDTTMAHHEDEDHQPGNAASTAAAAQDKKPSQASDGKCFLAPCMLQHGLAC